MLYEQMRYFITVARHMNFSEAAKELYVTQPTVSNKIAELEKQIGVKLLKRDKHTVSLTPAGKVFLKEAQHILEVTRESIEKTKKASYGSIGDLRIGFLAYALKQYLPSFIPYFQQKYPQVKLHLMQYNAEPLRKALLSEDVDIGITLAMALQESPQMTWKKLSTDNITVALNLDHPLAGKPDLKLSDLAKEPFITLSRDQSPYWYDFAMCVFARRGITPRIVSNASLMQTVLLMAENGLGVAITSRYAYKAYITSNLRHIEIEGADTSFDAVIAWKKTCTNASAKLFLSELEHAMQNSGNPHFCKSDVLLA